MENEKTNQQLTCSLDLHSSLAALQTTWALIVLIVSPAATKFLLPSQKVSQLHKHGRCLYLYAKGFVTMAGENQDVSCVLEIRLADQAL